MGLWYPQSWCCEYHGFRVIQTLISLGKYFNALAHLRWKIGLIMYFSLISWNTRRPNQFLFIRSFRRCGYMPHRAHQLLLVLVCLIPLCQMLVKYPFHPLFYIPRLQASPDALDLLRRMMELNPNKRPSGLSWIASNSRMKAPEHINSKYLCSINKYKCWRLSYCT